MGLGDDVSRYLLSMSSAASAEVSTETSTDVYLVPRSLYGAESLE